MLLNLTEVSTEPMHIQIYRQLSDKIVAGELLGGTKMESIRSFARSQRICMTTVRRAYEELESMGMLNLKNGQDFFIVSLSDKQKQALLNQRAIDNQSSLHVIETFSKQLISVFDPKKLKALLEENIRKFLQVKNIYFVTFEEEIGKCVFLPSTGFPNECHIDNRDDLFKMIKKMRLPVGLSTLDPYPGGKGLALELRARNVELILPLIESDEFLGFLGLTGKIGGSRYSVDELNLLKILTNQFVTALTTARFYVEAVEKRRMQEEVITALQVQNDLLPKNLPDDDFISISAHTFSSGTVSGDFYDYLPVDDRRFGLVIGDACGKGLPAAMLISQIQAMLKSELNNGNELPAILNNLNRQLVRFTPKNKFATLFYGIFDKTTRALEYATAGHNYPVLMRKDGSYEWLQIGGPALGVLEGAAYKTGKIRLNPGDLIFFYTDGITETMNESHKEYGEKRLLNLLRDRRRYTTQAIVDCVLTALNEFEAVEFQHDDRTMMILKMKG